MVVVQILSLRSIGVSANGLTEPFAGFYFSRKTGLVHCLYIVLKKLRAAPFRKVQSVRDYVRNLCSRAFQNMAVDVARCRDGRVT